MTFGFPQGRSDFMSPTLGSRWTTWGTVSSGSREIEIGWDRLESVGLLAPFLAPAQFSVGTRDTPQFQETMLNDLQGDLRFSDD